MAIEPLESALAVGGESGRIFGVDLDARAIAATVARPRLSLSLSQQASLSLSRRQAARALVVASCGSAARPVRWNDSMWATRAPAWRLEKRRIFRDWYTRAPHSSQVGQPRRRVNNNNNNNNSASSSRPFSHKETDETRA